MRVIKQGGVRTGMHRMDNRPRRLVIRTMSHVAAIGAMAATIVSGSALGQSTLQGGNPAGFERFSVPTPAHRPGQSATLLPDGRWLFAGGIKNGTVDAGLYAADASHGAAEPAVLPATLAVARTGHTATVLPNGTVLVFGGTGAGGQLVADAEVFDPYSGTISMIGATGLTPRTGHTATLLVDGRVLFAGGSGAAGRLEGAELLDSRLLRVVSPVIPLRDARTDHEAALLANGRGLVWGGLDGRGEQIQSGELYDPASNLFSAVDWWDDSSLPPPHLAMVPPEMESSSPAPDATNVPVDAHVAALLSSRLDPKTVNRATFSLVGPWGAVEGNVVSAEAGMLAFFTPSVDLLPNATYTAFLNGMRDVDGREMPFTSFSFTTHRFDAPSSSDSGASGSRPDANAPVNGLPGANGAALGQQSATADADPANQGAEEQDENTDDNVEDWNPRQENRTGSWRVLGLEGDPKLQLKPVADLLAQSGITAVSGRVVRMNGKGLAGVTVSAGGRTAVSDAAGRFLLPGLQPGVTQIKVDGTTAVSGGRRYTKHFMKVDVKAGKTNTLSTPVFLPRVDPATEIGISSPAAKDLVLTHPGIPGLEVHIPKGAVLREYDGKIVTKLSITPIPVDRAPYPTPVNFSVYFTLQPGGAFVDGEPDKVIRIVYPNYEGFRPGTSVNFWNYDPLQGWKVYGKGVVSRDGKQVIPDDDLGFRQIMTFGYGIGGPSGVAPPAEGPPPGGCEAMAGDPVDCATGLFLHHATDLVVKDVLPIVISRTYRPKDSVLRPFGMGTSMPYAMYLYTSSTANPPPVVDLILADGGRVRYALQSGTSYTDALWKHTSSPTAFNGSTLRVDAAVSRFVLSLNNGTTLTFDNHAPNQLQKITDRNGNSLTITLSGGNSGNITKVTSPSGRYVSFAYANASFPGQITSATDNIGRTVSYQYDTTGRLITATDPDNKSEQYGYDASNRMTTVTDKRNNVMVTNEYDANGRVFRQTLADNAIWQFAYTVVGGKVTQADVTDPRNVVRRMSFNTSGYVTQEVRALGQAEQQTYIYQRNASNLVTSVTDPLNRQTTFSYDSSGNVTAVTRLAGTANAVTDSYTYEPTFGRLTSYTDALNHKTQLNYDGLGNLISVADPLGHTIVVTNDGQGLPIAITNALNQTTQITYQQGGVAAVTDALGRTVSVFTDGLGRPLSVSDPLGNRTEYGYDAMARVVQVKDALDGITSMTYDANGNVLSVTDPRNVGSHSYTYDVRNRTQGYTDPLNKQENYTYDGLGNLLTYTDRRNQLTQYSYDPLNRLKTVTFNDNSTITITWDAGNRPTQIVDSQGGAINRQYDGLDRLMQEITPQGQVNYAYDNAGWRTQLTVAGSTPIIYGYDDANRLISITQGSSVVAPAYDEANRRTSLTLANGVVVGYGYNNGGELTDLTYSKGAAVLGTINYAYDAAGRRVGRVSSIDQTGTPASIGSTSDSRTFAWDARNQLISIGGGATGNFTYDAFGRRTGKTVAGISTNFLYDGLNLARELSGATQTAEYLAGLGVDEMFSRTSGGTTSTYLPDALGSTVALTDGAGAVETSYTYDAYGNTTTTGGPSSNSVQYTGRENDGTGLYYYRARYYSPQFGRFVSSDPIGLEGSSNTYAYVDSFGILGPHCNPISCIDPFGLWSFSVDAYGGWGGGVTVGRNERTGGWFVSGRLGIGFGLGAGLDPFDNGPADRPRKPGPYADLCSDLNAPLTGTSVGGFAGFGGTLGLLNAGYGGGGGRNFDGTGTSYGGPMQPNSNLNPFSDKRGVGIGAAGGFEVGGWW